VVMEECKAWSGIRNEYKTLNCSHYLKNYLA
jgi:hypothetical protein